MEDVESAVCKFCFQLFNDTSLTSIDNVRVMVKCLLPANDIAENLIICHACLINLKCAYNFIKAANENNLKIPEASIENDVDLCQTCLKPVESVHVYLYDRLDNIVPLPLIKRMLECSLISLNLEYHRYPIMCDDCWKILNFSYSFLMCCVQNERQLYKEHNYSLFNGCNDIQLRNAISYQKDVRNCTYEKYTLVENVFSDLKIEMEEPIIIKQEFNEETENVMEQHRCLNNAPIEISSDALEVNEEKNENASLTVDNLFMVEKFEFEDNFDCVEVEDCDIKSFEELNPAGDEILQNSNIKENEIIKVEENSNVKMSWPNDFKKKLYIKLEKLVLTDKKSLMDRRRKHNQIYKCHLCSYSSKNKYKYSRHLNTHLTLEDCAKNNTLYKCNNCSYMTKVKYSLRRHMKQVHRCIYICQQCDYETNETETFTLHIKLQHNNNIIAYTCELCSYSCYTKLQLKHHVNTHDLNKIILKCSQCAFETKEILTLNKHMMNHKNMRVSKLYKCEICTYQVKKKSGISRHVLTHATAKELFNANILYQCHECDYKTKRKDSLIGHIHNRHRAFNERKKEASISKK